MTTSQPIACSLDADGYADRVAWTAALNRDALRASRHHDLTLELEYDPNAAERVRELVRREQQCCAFLTFALDVRADAVVLRITAPPETRAATDAIFAPFVTGSARVRSAAVAVLACAVCCALPLTIPVGSVSAVSGALALFARAYW
jgi:hypothetical protein